MKFASALILACACACVSAQFGVKGTSSGSSASSRVSFFPRLSAGSIQEKKEQLQLANVDDEIVTTNTGFVQPAVTVVSEQQQGVLVPSSGAVSSVSSVSVPVAPVTTTVVEPQTSFNFVPSFTPVFQPQLTRVAQVAQPAVQTVQTLQTVPTFAKTFKAAKEYVYENQQQQPVQQLVQFSAQSAPAIPTYSQNIVHYAVQPQPQPQQYTFYTQAQPQPQVVQTVQSIPSYTTTSFTTPVVSRKVYNRVAPAPQPAVVSQSAQFFTDNKISGYSQQQLPTVFSQEKQSADSVQTNDW